MTAYAQPYSDPTDVAGPRIGAFVIDTILMSIVALAVIVPLFNSTAEKVPADQYECVTDGDNDGSVSRGVAKFEVDTTYCFEVGDDVYVIPPDDENVFTLQWLSIYFGIQALNLVVLQGLTGASVGKHLLGLRVIREDGRIANIGWAALRWIILFIDQIFCFMPGIILLFTTKGHRRLGDMAASTFVVRKSAVGAPPQVPGVNVPAWPAGVGGYPGPGAPGAWGAQPPQQPGTWAPPGAGYSSPQQSGPAPGQPPAGPAPGGAPGGGAGGDGPTWDPARNAYIQYDRAQQAWVQWNDDAQEWRPIDQ